MFLIKKGNQLYTKELLSNQENCQGWRRPCELEGMGIVLRYLVEYEIIFIYIVSFMTK